MKTRLCRAFRMPLMVACLFTLSLPARSQTDAEEPRPQDLPSRRDFAETANLLNRAHELRSSDEPLEIRIEKAEAFCEGLEKDTPQYSQVLGEGLAVLVDLYLEAEDVERLEDMVARYDEILGRDLSYALSRAYENLAKVHLQRGELGEAVELAEKSYLEPSWEFTEGKRLMLALAYAENGQQLKQAEAMAEGTLFLCQRVKQALAEGTDAGNVYRARRLEAGVEAKAQAVLGIVAWKRGKAEEATQHLRTAGELGAGEDAFLGLKLGRLLLDWGEAEEALKLLARASEARRSYEPLHEYWKAEARQELEEAYKKEHGTLAGLESLMREARPEQLRVARPLRQLDTTKIKIGQVLEIVGPDLSGEPFDLEELRGKVVLIDFWATWCGPCVAELPNLQRAYERYHADGFEVVGISLDQTKDKLTEFVRKNEVPWTQIFFDKEGARGWANPIARQYGIRSIPSTFLVDTTGKVVKANLRGSALSIAVAELLGKSPPTRKELLQAELTKLNQAIEADPDDGDAHHRRGHVYDKYQEWEKAAADYKKALELDGESVHLYLASARARQRAGDLNGAEDHFGRAIEAEPDSADGYHQLGHLFQKRRKWERAAENFSEALERKPNDLHLHMARARSYLRMEDYAKAAEDYETFENLLERGSHPSAAYNDLAWSYATSPNPLQDGEKALRFAQKAVSLQPSVPRFLRTLGAAYYRLAEYEKALDTLQRAVEQNAEGGTAFGFLFLAMSHDRLNEPDQARACYDQAVSWRDRKKNLGAVQASELSDLFAESEALLGIAANSHAGRP